MGKKKTKQPSLKKKLHLWLRANFSFKRLFVSLLSLMLFAGIVIFLGLSYLLKDMPDIHEMAVRDNRPQITLYDGDGVVLAKYGDFRGETLTYSSIPTQMVEAVVAAEDRRFFDHSGIDIIGILRAYFVNMRAGRVVQGGSTVTQQLAKVIYLSPERTFKRKLQEIIIAFELERRFSKEQIITLYLNRVYLGKGNYGIDAASRYYFGKRASEMTLFECAIIAGLLKAPSKYSPANNLSLAVGRGRQVLELMRNEGFITDEQLKHAIPPSVVERGIGRGALKNPYFADYILNEAAELVDAGGQNVHIYTTLNLKAQEALENVLAQQASVARKQYNAQQVAGLVMESNGAIKAMVGGASYAESQFNRAVSAHRQPGSSFKYVVYMAGLEGGIEPYDTIIDEPISIKQGKGLPLWKPRNVDRKYRGAITVEEAFSHSVNTVTVKISEQVGVRKVVDMAHRLGIKEHIPELSSIALGSVEVSLLEMVQAYAHAASYGRVVQAFGIIRILDDAGGVLYEYSAPASAQVVDADVVGKMRALMRATVEVGRGKNAAIAGHEVYGKTGTTQDFRDAWFIGFVDNIVTGIWMGNDDSTPTKALGGSTLPAKSFRQFYEAAGSIPPTKLPDDGGFWGGESVFDVIFGNGSST